MYYLNIRNNYSLNLLFSWLIGYLYFKQLNYIFFAFILLSIAYLMIVLPFFILQALTKWSLALSYFFSCILTYLGFILLFKGDIDFITEFIKTHQGPRFWIFNVPFILINSLSIFLLKIKEDSKKMKGEIEQ